MIYVSIYFYIFVMGLLVVYYVLPKERQWYILLIGSILIYVQVAGRGIILLGFLSVFSYFSGKLLSNKYKSKIFLYFSILVVLFPLCATKILVDLKFLHTLGLSFFTLQIIAYLVDVYRDEIKPEENICKYILFIAFFPQIVQGPIPRFKQLGKQLCSGVEFDEIIFTKGLHLIIWGFFLKYMIADKASIVVNILFDNDGYSGLYVWIAGGLYSFQLYADFLACVCMAQGIAALFGIELVDNFKHPYFSRSIKEFWRKWHISLSSWLRDYVYIPLGGSKTGKIRKYINLFITFVVSGFWHGNGLKYIMWGGLHATYQIVGELTIGIRDAIYIKIHMKKDGIVRKVLQNIMTFFWVMIAWIMFRASSVRQGIRMICSMLRIDNPKILWDGSLCNIGLTEQEWIVLIISICILIIVSFLQQKICIRDEILKCNIVLRWFLYIIAILGIVVFGTYGEGFDAQEFIYGGF